MADPTRSSSAFTSFTNTKRAARASAEFRSSFRASRNRSSPPRANSGIRVSAASPDSPAAVSRVSKSTKRCIARVEPSRPSMVKFSSLRY